MYYYGTREDAKGQLLMTSYGKKKQREQFVKGDARLYDGYRYVNLESGEFADSDNLQVEPDELIVRSYLDTRKPGEGSTKGNFQIFAFLEGEWKPTQFRAERYGGANTLMKALAPIYGKVMVVEHEPTGGEGVAEVSFQSREGDPF